MQYQIIGQDLKSRCILSNKNANGWKMQIDVERGISFEGIRM